MFSANARSLYYLHHKYDQNGANICKILLLQLWPKREKDREKKRKTRHRSAVFGQPGFCCLSFAVSRRRCPRLPHQSHQSWRSIQTNPKDSTSNKSTAGRVAPNHHHLHLLFPHFSLSPVSLYLSPSLLDKWPFMWHAQSLCNDGDGQSASSGRLSLLATISQQLRQSDRVE